MEQDLSQAGGGWGWGLVGSPLQRCIDGGGVKDISVDWGHAPKVTNVASSTTYHS